ncbi:MAG: hypothetical protein COT90_03850 [Candidatus Diapherotrites archaeon CG10_big_fil_rev_8_21_14_0_10_31_34]|nr:MAG: hypothetical protein COT90_03850 [Candidatus Diapherotrites archaeon CG10_big_fil_rev_8_21_14_0_10_31_34]
MSLPAALMSILVPGTGQVYHRKYVEGAIIFFLWGVWIILTTYFIKLELVFVLVGWLFFVAFSSIDAILFESKKVREEDIQIKEFEEMEESTEKRKKFKEIDDKVREALND